MSDEEKTLLIEAKQHTSCECTRTRLQLSRVAFIGASLVILLIVLVITVSLILKQHGHVSSLYKASVGVYKKGAVVSDYEDCSRIGSDIMQLYNGSVADAAVATTLCNGVTSIQAAGIGGGHFIILYARPRGENQRVAVSVNGREMAPSYAYDTMYDEIEGTMDSVRGGMAIAIPGELKGLHDIWERFGRLPWKQLVQPAIDIAENGFIISPIQEKRIRDKLDLIKQFPDLRSILLKKDGTPYVAGDTLKRPIYARTLERIRDHGANDFYTGQLAEDVILDIKDADGNITLDDLKSYTVEVNSPLTVSLENGDLDLLVPCLPSGGLVVQFILRVLQGFKFPYRSVKDVREDVDMYQIIIETYKFAYALRSYLGDPEFVDVSEAITNMTSDTFIRQIMSKIDKERTHKLDYYNAAFSPAIDHGTSHYSIVSPEGTAAAITSSINTYFGSLVVGKRTGIIFNNEMDDFSKIGSDNEWGLRPSEANYIKSGKRPLSSMSPIILLDHFSKEPKLVIGGAGGSYIPTVVSLVTFLNIHRDMALADAVNFARVHHQLLPDEVSHESGVPKIVLEELVAKGHALDEDNYIGVVNGIERQCDQKGLDCISTAVGDARRYAKPWGWN